MKISVITVTYNSEKTLRDTIDSVRRQDHDNLEYIIVDGGSTDNTLKIIEENKDCIDIWVSEKDKGIYDAMNKGIALATGEVVGFLNSDDFYAATDVVSTIAQTIDQQPQLDGIHADLFYVNATDTNKVVRYWHTRPFPNGGFFAGWHPAHPTFYIRKSVYERLGGYRLDLPLSADFELMFRYIQCHHIQTQHIEKVFIRMRVGGATSKNLLSVWRGIRQCRKAFEVNQQHMPRLYPFYRLLPKLFQFIHSEVPNERLS